MFKKGFYKSELKSFDLIEIEKSFNSFLSTNFEYKEQFLQSNYSYGFDGYSYLGQKNSTNQYSTDLLHSFVISDFIDFNLFPKEFHSFFLKKWDTLQTEIRALEKFILSELNIDGLIDFYDNNIGHMISCNYYPKIENRTIKQPERLSMHTDVSLLTVFPFGFDSDFYFEDSNGKWQNIEATNQVVVFPGYLLEKISKGKIKALNHKVILPEIRDSERFSFAYFSLPYPNKKFEINNKSTTSEEYFKDYLSLF